MYAFCFNALQRLPVYCYNESWKLDATVLILLMSLGRVRHSCIVFLVDLHRVVGSHGSLAFAEDLFFVDNWTFSVSICYCHLLSQPAIITHPRSIYAFLFSFLFYYAALLDIIHTRVLLLWINPNLLVWLISTLLLCSVPVFSFSLRLSYLHLCLFNAATVCILLFHAWPA